MKQTQFAIVEILGTKPISTLFQWLPHNEALAAAKGSIILHSSAGLGSVAASEGRSVAQVCEAFLQTGLVAYEKEGSKYVSRYLASHEMGKER